MTNSAELLNLVEAFVGTEVLVVGDLIVDHYIWGGVNRISPEAPVVVVDVEKEERRLGGAANVAHNLCALGAAVSICGVVGDDLEGRELTDRMERMKIDTKGVFVDRSRPTTIKTRIVAHAQQVVRVDRECRLPLSEAFQESISAEVRAQFARVKSIAVSDYGKGVVTPLIFKRLEGQAGINGVPVVVDPKDPNFLNYTGATVIKPNRKEAEQASGMKIATRDDAVGVGHKLLSLWNTDFVLITLGEKGMVLVSRLDEYSEPVAIDTLAQEVYDVSGAGDTVSAVFTLALAAGGSPRHAAELANLAAGIVVAEVGTVAVEKTELISRLREFAV
ncbi:MAG: D-glycero-beta-D-manno-heptose-7-phosphate kinase [bacterium]|nr:D-glycero-beta-D-manno-heptose-7-phosphate kinase [bacterium]